MNGGIPVLIPHEHDRVWQKFNIKSFSTQKYQNSHHWHIAVFRNYKFNKLIAKFENQVNYSPRNYVLELVTIRSLHKQLRVEPVPSFIYDACVGIGIHVALAGHSFTDTAPIHSNHHKLLSKYLV